MKRIGQLLLCLICLFGCTNPKQAEDQQFMIYNQIKEQLMRRTTFDKEYPFKVLLLYNSLDNHFRYDIFIQDVQEDMYGIVAMAYAQEDENQVCPSIGLFDEEEYHLKKGFVDKANGYYKGIQLSGTSHEKRPVKLYICYYTDELKKNKIEKYIEVSEDEIR